MINHTANGMLVSVVVPIRNEADHISACLESLINQSFPSEKYEVIAVDGNSSDATASIIRQVQKVSSNLQLVENPAGITPIGMNLGIRCARGAIIVIASAHATYPRDFIETSVKQLDMRGADVVGGPLVTVAADTSFGARLVAAVLSNPFGVGNSNFRTSREEGFVDTVPFGAFRKEIFDRVGMYNEKLVRNQDNDLNARIRKAGGKIYLTPALTTHYHPVKSFSGLLKYAFKTSKWHIFTLRENRQSMGLRHLAPAMFLGLLLLVLPVSFVRTWALDFLIGVLCTYILTGLYFSMRSEAEGSWDVALVQPLATFCFHIAYGAGTLFGLRYLFGQPSVAPIRPGLPIQQ